MKKNKILLAVLALVMALGLGIGSAMAYFTTYVTAKGGMPIRLGDKTSIEEPKVENRIKHLVVKNNGANAVYVRARAYAPAGLKIQYDNVDKENGPWVYNEKDGYCYYIKILPGKDPDVQYESKEKEEKAAEKEGRVTSELLVKFEEPEDAKEGDDFNVVVVYESTPVLYDEKGDPYPYDKADWNQILDVEEEGGNS